MKTRRSASGSYQPSGRAELRARVRSRFSVALLLSIALHAFILLLKLYEPGWGLPGLAFPWADPRAQAPDLTVRMAEQDQAQEAEPPAVPPSEPSPPRVAGKSRSSRLPRDDGGFEIQPLETAQAPAPRKRSRQRRQSPSAAPENRTPPPPEKFESAPQPDILALEPPREDTFSVPSPSEEETGLAAEAERQKEEEARRLALEEANRKAAEEARQAAEVERRREEERQRVLAAEQARQEEDAARLAQQRAAAAEEGRRKAEEEARQKGEAARQLATEEARRKADEESRLRAEDEKRQEAARQLAIRNEQEAREREEAQRLVLEAARRKAEVEKGKEEEARRAALEAARRAEDEARRKADAEQRRLAEAEARRKAEEARQAALEDAKRKAEEEAKRRAEGERRREEEARLAQEKAAGEAERGRVSATPEAPGTEASPATGTPSGKDIAARALGQFRAPTGVVPSPIPAPRAENPRRRSVFGVEREVIVRWYVESWRSKIERNGPLNYRPLAGQRAPEDPVVTVSIRSDGSLEDVHIHRSSGLRELDEAVRRIARLYAPYSKFPPELARQYDVIEIRRVWQFDQSLRIMEEMN